MTDNIFKFVYLFSNRKYYEVANGKNTILFYINILKKDYVIKYIKGKNSGENKK